MRKGESESERFDRLYGCLLDFGESELVLNGLHENVLRMRYFDTGMLKTSAIVGAEAGIFSRI